MASKKQRTAARNNIKKAAGASKRKQTLKKLPKKPGARSENRRRKPDNRGDDLIVNPNSPSGIDFTQVADFQTANEIVVGSFLLGASGVRRLQVVPYNR
jgi:hypothetical protein